MGRPKTRRNKGGATANSEVEENYEDARGSDVDTAEVVGSTAGEESSQDDRSVDGSVVKNKPFQFTKGVQPSRRKLAQQEANAFCIQMTVTSEERGQAGMPPPRYAWSEVVIRDIVQAWLPTEIHEVLITVPGEAIIFFAPRSQKRGLSREDAMELATHFPSQKHWVGKAVAITSRVINLFTARGYCHMAREYRKAKKAANNKASDGALKKKTSRVAARAVVSGRNTNANAAQAPSETSARTASWIEDQNSRGKRNDRRRPKRPRDGQGGRRRGQGPPGGGGGDDPGWDDWSDSPDEQDEDDARSYSTMSDTTRRGGTASQVSTVSGGGVRRRRPGRNQGKPNLPMYGSSKDEMTYHTWRCYVLGLRNHGHSDPSILTAIQNSLRGPAGEHYATLAARPWDPARGRQLDQVIADLDRHFGFATNYDGMMSELYKMRQEAFESVSYFGIRLQRQIAAIAGEYPDQMGPEDQERASRNRFYEGLRGELKHPLKYLVGRPEGATYSELIEEARRMEGRARGPVLPSEFNGPAPKKDTAAADGYPRNPKRTNYFQKIKGAYRPAVRAAHLEPAQTEEPEAPAREEADDEAEEDNYDDLLTSLAEVATGDPDEGSGFVVGLYKLGAEVERRTRVCYYCKSPDHLIRDCALFETAQEALNLRGGVEQKGNRPPAKKSSSWQPKPPSNNRSTSDTANPSSAQK